MKRVRIDYRDGQYSLILVEKDYGPDDDLKYNVVAIDDRIWDAYVTFRNQMCVWDQLILSWDNDLAQRRNEI